MNLFSQELDRQLKASGQSEADISAKSGLSPQLLDHWLRGGSILLEHVCYLAPALSQNPREQARLHAARMADIEKQNRAMQSDRLFGTEIESHLVTLQVLVVILLLGGLAGWFLFRSQNPARYQMQTIKDSNGLAYVVTCDTVTGRSTAVAVSVLEMESR